MPIQNEVFRQGRDVYIDYPFEQVMLHWLHESHKVFRKFYGQEEEEISENSRLFADAELDGDEITAEQYAVGKPDDPNMRAKI
jgi:hypothetical protein